jgi:hypothetical protein
MRLATKCYEFLSGGMIPGTMISDGLHLIENLNYQEQKRDYKSPTILNGMYGGSKK